MKTVKLYVHANKESNFRIGVDSGLAGEALQRFLFAGYEHEITYAVDERTGEATAIEFDGRKISKQPKRTS